MDEGRFLRSEYDRITVSRMFVWSGWRDSFELFRSDLWDIRLHGQRDGISHQGSETRLRTRQLGVALPGPRGQNEAVRAGYLRTEAEAKAGDHAAEANCP